MADAFVQVATDGTGKQLQTHSNVIATQTVHAQATVLVDVNGAPIGTLASPQIGQQRAANLLVTATQTAIGALTLTLPAPAAGLFHYLSSIDFNLYSLGARTGVAAPILVTSTNLPGTPAWTFETAAVIGAISRYQPLTGGAPLKSNVAATASTIAMPSVANGLWRCTVMYYTAP